MCKPLWMTFNVFHNLVSVWFSRFSSKAYYFKVDCTLGKLFFPTLIYSFCTFVHTLTSLWNCSNCTIFNFLNSAHESKFGLHTFLSLIHRAGSDLVALNFHRLYKICNHLLICELPLSLLLDVFLPMKFGFHSALNFFSELSKPLDT